MLWGDTTTAVGCFGGLFTLCWILVYTAVVSPTRKREVFAFFVAFSRFFFVGVDGVGGGGSGARGVGARVGGKKLAGFAAP